MNSCVATKVGKNSSPAVELVRDVYKQVALQALEENGPGEVSGSIKTPYS
jgi:hypothetical protein